MNRTPPFSAFLPTIIILVLVGFGGLVVLLNATTPTLGPRWMFFFLLVVAFTGLALPLMVVLNHRFPTDPAADVGVVVREATWVGIYVATLAWLQYGQVLSSGLALIFLVGFIVIEAFLRLRERGVWRQSDG